MHERPSRKPMRYRGHDYRAPCTVHVTICTHHRQRLFGAVTATGMHLNDTGQFVADALKRLHSEADGIAVDTSIVMPDHVHAIIVLGTNPEVITTASIPTLVEAFKMRVFKSWPRGVRLGGWVPYDAHLWQRTYFDTVIRNDRHLQATREYILANPARWVEPMESQP